MLTFTRTYNIVKTMFIGKEAYSNYVKIVLYI